MASADSGDLLLEHQSGLGTLPDQQGWLQAGHCLMANCPVSLPPNLNECYWQGGRDLDGDLVFDNDCMFSVGCHKATEHYNSPTYDPGPVDACSYTEWITFDDGNNAGDRLIVPDSSVTHSPPWGAPGFFDAPSDHDVIRISTGDGNQDTYSLAAGTGNNRNKGRVEISQLYAWSATNNAVTVLIKCASGPFKAGHSFLQVRTPNARFAFFVNGEEGHPDFGRVGFGDGINVYGYLFGATSVVVTLPGVVGPHAGEFFTLRVICRDDGTFTAYFNEERSTKCFGFVGTGLYIPDLRFGALNTGDDCVWVDFVQLFEGAVPPAGCGDPVFDVNDDGRVNEGDLHDGFMIGSFDCATGPAPRDGIFAVLPEACKCLDVNGDRALDMQDFGVFQRCLTIGGGLVDPACDDVP